MAAQRLRVLERQERHRRFRPDHVRDAGEIVDGRRPDRGATAPGGRGRCAAWCSRPPLLALRHARLHDAQRACPAWSSGRRTAARPSPGCHEQRHERNGQRGSRARWRPRGAGRRLGPQDRRQGKMSDGAQRQPVDAEHGRALHQRQRLGQRIAERVPGKAVSTWPRSHSRPTSVSASTSTRAAPGARSARRSRPPRHRTAPVRPAAGPRRTAAARRTSRPRRETPRRSRTGPPGSSRSRTTSRPARRRRAGPMPARAPRAAAPARAPSISHTSTGSVSHSTGQAKNGAMASTGHGAGRERGQRAPPAREAAHCARRAA